MFSSRAPKLHHNGGEVIFGPALMDYSFQLVGRALRVFVLREDSRDFFVRHVSIDAVAAKQKAGAIVKGAEQTIMGSPSWRQGQDAIFIVSDEGDYTGTPESQQNGGWDSPAGCCDSPVVAAGDTDIDPTWPGGVYGGGLVPAVVIVNHDGKTGGYVSQTAYNHYSLLATIEQVWDLPKLAYASDSSQVTPMTEFFTP